MTFKFNTLLIDAGMVLEDCVLIWQAPADHPLDAAPLEADDGGSNSQPALLRDLLSRPYWVCFTGRPNDLSLTGAFRATRLPIIDETGTDPTVEGTESAMDHYELAHFGGLDHLRGKVRVDWGEDFERTSTHVARPERSNKRIVNYIA